MQKLVCSSEFFEGLDFLVTFLAMKKVTKKALSFAKDFPPHIILHAQVLFWQ